jgi:hypothetical protein
LARDRFLGRDDPPFLLAPFGVHGVTSVTAFVEQAYRQSKVAAIARGPGGRRMFALAPSQGDVEIGAVQKYCAPGNPTPCPALDLAILLGRGGLGARPVFERLPLPDQALMADVEEGVAGQRPIRRWHQQAAARRAERVGDRRALV